MIILILLASAAIIAAIWLIGGNYFINFALRRSRDKEWGKSGPRPPSPPRSELMSSNYAEANERAKKWRTAANAERVTITSADGCHLVADVFDAGGRDARWVLLAHGYRGSRREMDSYACKYAERGYSVLIPDLRGHGESDGEYIGMGWLDAGDIALWLDWLSERAPGARAVLHGHSMGGATVLMAGGANPTNVRAVIADCAYTSAWAMFSRALNTWFHLPAFPALGMSNSLFKLRGGYDLHSANPLAAVKTSLIPTLFIHGAADKFIPPEMSRELYAAATCEKELLIVEGAGHVQSQFASPERYWGAVDDFLARRE